MICANYFNGFLLGYASSSKYAADAWRLFGIYLIINLLIIFLLHLALKALKPFSLIVTSVEILIFYGIMAGLYR